MPRHAIVWLMLLIVVSLLCGSCTSHKQVVIPLSIDDISPQEVLKTNLEEDFKILSHFDRNLWGFFGSNTKEQIRNGLTIRTYKSVKCLGGIKSKFYLTEDFDIEVSYEIEKWSTDSATLGLSLNTDFKDKTDEVYVSRSHFDKPSESVYQTGLRIAGQYRPLYESTDKTSDKNGKLRIKREKGYVTAYYSYNDQWVALKNYPMPLDFPFKVILYVKNYVTNKTVPMGEIKVKFNTLRIKTMQ